jgi:hypothetical protein
MTLQEEMLKLKRPKFQPSKLLYIYAYTLNDGYDSLPFLHCLEWDG